MKTQMFKRFIEDSIAQRKALKECLMSLVDGPYTEQSVSLVNTRTVLDTLPEEQPEEGKGTFTHYPDTQDRMVSKWLSYDTLGEVFEGLMAENFTAPLIERFPLLKNTAIDALMQRIEELFIEELNGSEDK